LLCFYVITYGFETWSLTLKEGHRLKVFENMVLRGMFGLKRDMRGCEVGENCIMSFIISNENKVYAPSSVTNLFIIVVIRKFLGP
jgi:hypothetical protein